MQDSDIQWSERQLTIVCNSCWMNNWQLETYSDGKSTTEKNCRISKQVQIQMLRKLIISRPKSIQASKSTWTGLIKVDTVSGNASHRQIFRFRERRPGKRPRPNVFDMSTITALARDLLGFLGQDIQQDWGSMGARTKDSPTDLKPMRAIFLCFGGIFENLIPENLIWKKRRVVPTLYSKTSRDRRQCLLRHWIWRHCDPITADCQRH